VAGSVAAGRPAGCARLFGPLLQREQQLPARRDAVVPPALTAVVHTRGCRAAVAAAAAGRGAAR
jgi:hypothetical protein